MPVLEPVSDDYASHEAREIFDRLQEKLRMGPHILRTMAHAPELLGATLTFNGSFQNGLDRCGEELSGDRSRRGVLS